MTSLATERIAISSGSALLQAGLPVERVIDLLAAGRSIEDILSQYPRLEREDILACLEFACSH